MDPVLSKLLDLWELDESSISRHSLPGGSHFSMSSYLLYNDKSRQQADSLVSNTSSSEGEAQISELNFCKQCRQPNQDFANWCVECGAAMVGTRMPSEKLQLQYDSISDICANASDSCSPELSPCLFDKDMEQTSMSEIDYGSLNSRSSEYSEHTLMGVTPSIENGQCVTDNHLNMSDSIGNDNQQIDSGHKVYPKSINLFSPMSTISSVRTQNVSDAANIDTDSSWLVARKDYQRHWNSSSVYMWRKPSSIHESNHQALPDDAASSGLVKFLPTVHDQSGELHLPLLDLSATEDDTNSECTSTIASSCTNKHLIRAERLLSLPDEIILLVLSNLAQKDLTNCMLVCRRLFHIASDISLWKCIQVSRCSCISYRQLRWLVKKRPVSISLYNCKGSLKLGEIQRFFINVANSLKVFDMTLCDFGVRSGDTMFSNAALYCPNLHSITFNWCNLAESTIIKGFQTFSRLEAVSIEQQSGAFSNEVTHVLIKKHGKTLRKLDVGSSDSSVVISACSRYKLPNLVSFAGTFIKVDEPTFKSIAFVFPKLKQLTIRHYTELALSHEIAQQLSNNVGLLESLSLKLSNSSALTHFNCAHINQMTSLRSLVLDCVNDEALKTLCSGKLKLRFLDLSQSAITDKSFTLIGESSFSSTITYVRMRKCHGIDTSCSSRVMANLKHGHSFAHQRTFQQLLMEFTLQCKRLRVVDLLWLYCVQDLNLKDFKHCTILIN